jgi:hypothetical protein
MAHRLLPMLHISSNPQNKPGTGQFITLAHAYCRASNFVHIPVRGRLQMAWQRLT